MILYQRLALYQTAPPEIKKARAASESDATDAESRARQEAFAEARISARRAAWPEGVSVGKKAGIAAGAKDGEQDADAQLQAQEEAAAAVTAAATPDTNGPNDPCPPGTNFVPFAGRCVNGDY